MDPQVDTRVWNDELACLESIVDRLALVVDARADEPTLTTDQICEFLELLHPLLNSDTSEDRLRHLVIDSRPDIWTVLFSFAKRRDDFAMDSDTDSPRVRREVLRVLCRLVVLCKSSGMGHPEGEGPPGLAGLCSQAVMNEDGVAVLLACLTTETDDVARSHCAEAIARLCEGSQMTMLSVMVQKGLAILITSLSRDSSPQVRRFCTLGLGAFARGYSLDVVKEGGVQVLVERLSIDSSTAVRSLAAEILAHLLYNHREATQEAVTRRGLAGILHARILEDSSCEVVESCLRLVELLTRLREGDFCGEFVRLGGAPAIMKRLRSPAPTAKLVLRTIRTLVECAPKSLEVGRRVVMHFQSLSSLMELALDEQGEDPQDYANMEPSAMYDEAQLKAELALTLGIICAHSVACRDHLATELGRLPMWAKSIRHHLLSALQDVSPNAFSDLMIYDEENVLLNSTEGWDGVNPKKRAGDALHSQRQRWELRQGAEESEPIPEDVPEEPQGWSMVGTNAALALTQEILRQALEQALKCPDQQPKSRKLTQAQKDALFERICTYVEMHGGRLLEVFRRFDKDKSGAVDVAELERMLQSLGMTFTQAERMGLLKLFDENGDGRVSYKEFLDICHQHKPGASKGFGGKHTAGVSQSASQAAATPVVSSTPRSTSQYQEYLSKMSSADHGMAARRSSKQTSPQSQASSRGVKTTKAVAKPKSRPSSARSAVSTPAEPDTEVEHKLAFSLEFPSITLARVQQMAKKAKKHCVDVKRKLVILPANRRPRRAALLAASQKAEKYRQSWETLAKLIAAQGESMVQETLAAMSKSFSTDITEETLVPIVHELVNRFPMPTESEEYPEGAGQAANSMGPLYATGSPAMPVSPMAGGGSPMGRGMDFGDESDSTDSEDDMGDLRLLGLA
jgi:hypothetical protein